MFKIRIVTPSGTYLTQSVDYLEVSAPHSVLGILTNHAPLVSTLIIAPLKTKVGNKTTYYAASSGIINVRKEETLILLDSIERVDEIDINRAIEAKKRAEEKLERAKNNDHTIDVARAESALSRALNRINVYTNKGE
ncbi:MAG: ATP synthase F1 subunit epsilon [Bacilli bacterium]|nr:ATP synthase F1 subunit epsilon [Bacilli bacterium]